MDSDPERTPLLPAKDNVPIAVEGPPSPPPGAGDPEGGRSILTRRIIPNSASPALVFLGFLFAVLGGICFTSANVLVKFLPNIHSWQLLFVRCLVQVVAMLPLMVVARAHPLGSPDWGTRWRIMAQGVLGGVLLLAIFMAVSLLPLGDATAIFFSSPAFTMILSCFLLRDHCGFFRTFISVTLLGGVVIMSRPPALFPPAAGPDNSTNITTGLYDVDISNTVEETGYDMLGLAAAIAVPILSAWIVILQRQTKHVHYSVLVFWFGVGGLAVSLLGVFVIDTTVGLFEGWTTRDWLLTILVAVFGIVGSSFMTKSVCWVTPAKVMVVRSFEVLVAYILQVTLFASPTHVSDVAGALLVVGSVLGMGLEDWVMNKINWRFM